jgi:hypothetical protein
MKTIKLLLIALLFSFNSFAQITVNKVDISNEVDTFEVWAFKKPFSNKESLFVNYGQDKFRPHYYDHKTQRILNGSGEVFKKGSWLKLSSYLKKQGWIKTDERSETIGDITGRVVTFEKQ